MLVYYCLEQGVKTFIIHAKSYFASSKTLKTTSPQELFALTCLIQSQILLFDEAKNAFIKHESYSRFRLVGGEEL